MEGEYIRLRAACDRCHAQKLRCPKLPNATKCNRCSKAGSACIFSPFRQKKEEKVNRLDELGARVTLSESPKSRGKSKRQYSHFEETESYQNTADPFNLETTIYQPSPETVEDNWTFSAFDIDQPEKMNFMFEDPFDFSIKHACDSYNSNGNSMTAATSTEAEGCMSSSSRETQPSIGSFLPIILQELLDRNFRNGTSEQSDKYLINQLSLLNIALFDHLKTIPPISICRNGTAEEVQKRYKDFSVDETFKLTQELIDIYPKIINKFVKGNPSDFKDPDTPNTNISSHAETTPSTFSDESNAPEGHTVDHSAVLLLLSCHVRLLDIYDVMFKHMHLCMLDIDKPSSQGTVRFVPPKISIGSYQPPPSSAVPMQMLLLVQLSAQLSASASELAAHMRGPLPPTGASTEMDILSLATAEKVEIKANNMTLELRCVRTALLSSGFLA